MCCNTLIDTWEEFLFWNYFLLQQRLPSSVSAAAPQRKKTYSFFTDSSTVVAVLVVTLRPPAPAHWPTASDPYWGAVAENRGRWTKPKVQWTPIEGLTALTSSCSLKHICTLSLMWAFPFLWSLITMQMWFWGRFERSICPLATL